MDLGWGYRRSGADSDGDRLLAHPAQRKSAEKVGALGQKLADPIMRKLHKPMDLTKSILSFRGQVVDVVKPSGRG